MGDLLVVLVLALPLLGLWWLVRTQQRRAQVATEMLSELRIGQDVVTTSGLFGTIAALDDDSVTLLVAPGVELRFDRRAVGRVLDLEADRPSEDDTPGR